MNESLLTSEALSSISGGWDWDGFFTGFNWVLGVGCGTTGNPAVCGTWLVSQALDVLVM